MSAIKLLTISFCALLLGCNYTTTPTKVPDTTGKVVKTTVEKPQPSNNAEAPTAPWAGLEEEAFFEEACGGPTSFIKEALLPNVKDILEVVDENPLPDRKLLGALLGEYAIIVQARNDGVYEAILLKRGDASTWFLDFYATKAAINEKAGEDTTEEQLIEIFNKATGEYYCIYQ
jgi:hypothetical protein